MNIKELKQFRDEMPISIHPDRIIQFCEQRGFGWSLDHTGRMIEARIWDWPYCIGRYRPDRVEPLADMLWKALRDASFTDIAWTETEDENRRRRIGTYSGHVPCKKCGHTHWMHGSCRPCEYETDGGSCKICGKTAEEVLRTNEFQLREHLWRAAGVDEEGQRREDEVFLGAVARLLTQTPETYDNPHRNAGAIGRGISGGNPA